MDARTTESRKADIESVSAILKRVIAENGREHVKGYAFAIVCLLTVAATTAFTAWIMEAVINEAFANRGLTSCGSSADRSLRLSSFAALPATGRP